MKGLVPIAAESFENVWWTREQSAYIKRYIKNCANDLINEHFIKKLERTFAGSKSVTFKGKELPLEEPWISPETNDMEKFELPCCKQAIKIDEKWSGRRTDSLRISL